MHEYIAAASLVTVVAAVGEVAHVGGGARNVVMVGEVFTAYRALYYNIFFIFFGGLECVGHSFAFVPNFVFLRDVWIRTQKLP